MEKVTGIGGLFSRWRNPDARWYHENLGVTITPKSSDEMPWQQEAGPSGLSPFPDATDYFRDPSNRWSIFVFATLMRW